MIDSNTSLYKGYKYRLYPSEEQRIALARMFGANRFLYNRLLAKSMETYTSYKNGEVVEKPKVGRFDFQVQTMLLKAHPETSWLGESSASVMQNTCLKLAVAYKNFFKGLGGYPKFKSKRSIQSVTFPDPRRFRMEGKKLRLEKLGSTITVKLDRDLPSPPKQCAISMTPSGEYYASFLCEVDPIFTNGQGVVGIDAGITDIATISDGTSLPNPKHFIKSQKKLAKLQRRLSRKQKGSKNRSKARLKVARLHAHIANQRKDYLHKLTTKLIRENQAIAIESLQVSNMIRNRHLAKHIGDAGWGMMRQMLMYKAIHSGGGCRIFLADPYYPSTQLCSSCGVKPQLKIKLGVTKWICGHCGAHHHRDHNAAKNLAQLALRHMADPKDLKATITLTERYVQ